MSLSELKKDTAIIKILDEINVVVVGLKQDHYNELYKRFGIFQDGYIFKPAYKIGRWDGKSRFFSKIGKTSIHLLDEVIPILKEFGYKISIIDNRSQVSTKVPIINSKYLSDFCDENGDPIILGEHQVEAVNSITSSAGGIILAGTGAGKSIMTAALIKLYNDNKQFRCLVIVPNKDLINQTSKDISMFNIPVGKYYGDVKEPNVQNVVSTWQSLQNNPSLIALFDVIIVDEAHGTKGSKLKNMLLEYGNNALIRIGLTGTLPKDPEEFMCVKYVLGSVKYTMSASELIDKGWLAKLKLMIYQLDEDLIPEYNFFKSKNPKSTTKYTTFKKQFIEDYPAEKAFLQKNKNRLDFISTLIESSVIDSGNAFVLVNNVAFGKKLADNIENAYFIYGKDEAEVRKRVYALFAENNDIVVVSTFQLASTGLNIKRIFNMFLIDAGKSFIQIIQSIGRGLRKAKDKDSVNVYDICGDLKYGQKHLKKREAYYKEQHYTYKKKSIKYADLIDKSDGVVVY
jgi:superfamily II DNA or RNA helicase